MSQTYESRQVRFGYAEQTTFETAELDSAAMNEITCEAFNIDPDVMIHELPQNNGTRQPIEQNTAHSVKGSSAKFTVAGPVDISDIDQFAYAFFQRVEEAADSEFTKDFYFFTTHPDFTEDAGHFLTWIKRMPEASVSQKVLGCIANRFNLSAERDGMLMFETDWRALGTTNDTSNPSGTWTPPDGETFLYFNDIVTATLTHGAALASPTNLVMQSFEVEGVVEVDKIGHSATAGFEQHGIKNREGTFKIKMLRDSTADESLISLKEGELIKFTVDFGTLSFIVTGKIEALDYDADGLLVNEITCRIFANYEAGGVGNGFSITVKNSIDRAWPAPA